MSHPAEFEAFFAAYNRLNTAQKQAVDAIEGPVMVIAGPGTGKTQILTLRIANILRLTDTQPENILALTFTDSGAQAMRARLRTYIGAAAYRVPIFTFHGFAQRLISEYPDSFPRIIGGRAATDIEKVQILETILTDTQIKILRPLGDTTYYVPHILRIISTLKQEYISPDELARRVELEAQALLAIERYHTKGAHKGKVRGEYTKAEKNLNKNKELVFVYRLYEQLLKDKRLYDFEDMIAEAVLALSHEKDMLLDLQETYQYVLADEHQDVNGAQNKILELLCNFHSSPNIFVVGDEKQAIYRFQGASLDNFLYFVDLFPTTKTIVLNENYRSGQNILDAAYALMQTEDAALAPMRTPLTSALVANSTINQRLFSHQAVEDDWLIQLCKEKIAAGIPQNEIAIIVRTNREVETIAGRLRQASIPVTASADGDILEHPITQSVQALINFVVPGSGETALAAVLHGAYWGLSAEDTMRLLAARTYETSLTSILSDEETMRALGVQNIDSALMILKVLTAAREKSVHEAPHRVLEYVLDASGFIDHVIAHEPFEGVRVVRRVYDEVEAMVIRDGVSTLAAVSEILASRRQYGLPLQAPYIATHTHAVQVMTAHKAKGLEFSVVCIPHLQDSAWGGKTKRALFSIPMPNRVNSTFDPLEDERRLLYVGMTRAKTELYLSAAEHGILGKDTATARLLEEMSLELVPSFDVTESEKAFLPSTALRTNTTAKHISGEILTKLLQERGLTATSLNNYLKNPWDFLYRNMLRIPEVQPLHMQFGTVVHNVLEKLTAWHTKETTWPSDGQIQLWLEAELRRLPIHTEEYTRLHEKGMQTIFGYQNHLRSVLPPHTKEEMSIKVLFKTGLPQLSEIVLSGKIDRIDLSSDGYALRVVDYKTGKPKSRAAILGETESSDGAYKRQLTFYALLLSLYNDDRYTTPHGVLSFVEPGPSGVIKEEHFTTSEAEIEALSAEIVRAVSDITTGAFQEDEELLAASEYANLAAHLLRDAE